MSLYQTWQRSRRQRRESMNPLEMAIFFRQISTMIGAGAGVIASLRTCAQVAREPARSLLLKLADRVASGIMLSQAMRELPHTFSPVLCGLVEAGERGGGFVEVLNRVAQLTEREVNLRNRLTAAFLYPALLLACSLVSVTVFLCWGVPLMRPLVESSGADVGGLTRLIFGLSGLLRNPVVFWGGLILALDLWLLAPLVPVWFRHSPQAARGLAGLSLRVPLLARLEGRQVLYTMAVLAESGIPLDRGLLLAAQVTSNPVVSDRLHSCCDALREGATFSHALALEEVFHRAALQLIAVGEETARLPLMLERVARMYDQDVEYTTEVLLALVEPILMLGMGCMVGLLAVGVMSPILSLIQRL